MKTAELHAELLHALSRLCAYEESPGTWLHSTTHAALYRATMDLSRALAAWRQAAKPPGNTIK